MRARSAGGALSLGECWGRGSVEGRRGPRNGVRAGAIARDLPRNLMRKGWRVAERGLPDRDSVFGAAHGRPAPLFLPSSPPPPAPRQPARLRRRRRTTCLPAHHRTAVPHAYARTQRRRSRIARRRPADRPNRLPPHARACTSSRAMLTHIPFPALPVPPSWFPGHMLQFQRMLPALLNKTDVVLELRDARLPLTSINRNFEGACAFPPPPPAFLLWAPRSLLLVSYRSTIGGLINRDSGRLRMCTRGRCARPSYAAPVLSSGLHNWRSWTCRIISGATFAATGVPSSRLHMATL